MMENKTKIDLKNKSIFITGVAGFIGSNLAKRLLSTVEGVKVVGLDNMNNYYDVRLKEARLKELEQFEKFSFVKGNLADKAVIESIFEQYKPEIVVNLGAQAGVRYSITNPDAYVEANLIGFYNILEACRHSYDEGHTPVEHLVYSKKSDFLFKNVKIPLSYFYKILNDYFEAGEIEVYQKKLLDGICNELFTWADVYDTANHDERRAILQQFIKEIRVRKDYEISITLNASFNQVEQLKSVSIYDGAEIFEEISEKGA